MLITVHDDGLAFRQGGANGIGALAAFRPFRAWSQCNLSGFFPKIEVAKRVLDRAAAGGQDHHAVCVGDLFVQRFHHRNGVLKQKMVVFAQLSQRT